MKSRRHIHIAILIALILMLTLLFGFSEAMKLRPIHEETGNAAPDFLIEDLEGNKISLSSFRGKPVLLNFWATWCPYCRQERKHLNSLYSEYRDRGLIVVSISMDRSVSTVKRYLQHIPSEFVILTDLYGEVSAKYGITAIPTSFLITRDGNIKHKFMGYREWTSSSSKRIINSLVGS